MKKNMTGLIITAIAAIVYFASKASYAFPGISAHLQAVWRSLDPASSVSYPLMEIFAKLFGGGNMLAPVCGTIAVALVYYIVSSFVYERVTGEKTARYARELSIVAASASSLVFMLMPAVREGASHLEPRLFDAMWALAIIALVFPYFRLGGAFRHLIAIFAGALTAFGVCDSAIFVIVGPLFIVAIVFMEIKGEQRPFLPITLFALSGLVSFFVALSIFDLELIATIKSVVKELNEYRSVKNWILVAAFSTLPFYISIFSSNKAYNEQPDLVQWLFHLSMSVVSILAIATPLSSASLMEKLGVCPVVTSCYAAITAGYLISYWYLHRREVIGIAAGSVLAFVLIFSSLWNLFAFDGERGAFADEVARRTIDQLGGRKWLVTDGTIDDHLRIVAADRKLELNLISLNRDLDRKYIAELSRIVAEKNIAGSKNEDLLLSLSLGVLPFVQDWFASDPMVASEVAIWGAPDLWYSSGFKPVPEIFFFGADEKRAQDWTKWQEMDELLHAEKGWGSYKGLDDVDPVTRLRYSLRRHLGLVANNYGVYLQDHGNNTDAFGMYELVLNEIDTDNVCSLFNEIQMAGDNYPDALTKKAELERNLKAIQDDKARRYVFWRLGSYYGYIRNPDLFVRLGYAWARSGRPGDALAQIRRAIDFVPSDKRSSFLNMMAALYASDNNKQKSRELYESVLSRNASDHDALIGMMRLKLLDGDSEKALEYLQRAVATSADGGRSAQMELAMVAMMKGDYKGAKDLLKKVVNADDKDLRALGMLAAVNIQHFDSLKDEKERKRILKEVTDNLLPRMEKCATSAYDYYVQLTKAFVLMRSGNDAQKRREARAALEIAAKARPDSQETQELVLGLDISLDDKVSAERHAREALRKNRNAPLANYAMGSLSIRKGEFREAEAFLRKAVNVPRPQVLALNDLAEVLRRNEKLAEAERYARKAIEVSPDFYVAHETLGVILLDAKRDVEEAEASIRKAILLSKKQLKEGEDVRLYTSLARAQLLHQDKKGARNSLRKVQLRLSELTEFERREYEEVNRSAH